MNDAEALAALAERVRHLEDLDEIRQLYVDYGRHLDDGDASAYAALFARSGKLRLGPVARADGREEIERAAAELMRRAPDGSMTSAHVIGSPRVDLSGDTATGESVWVAVSTGADGTSTVLVGRHVDDLVREDGRWRFARRRGFVDIAPATSPLTNRPGR